jgi:Domain of unknown function (DUF4878)
MKTGYTKAVAVALIITALFAAACNKGTTPTATFQAYVDAVKNKDVDGIKKTLSKKTLELFEASAKAMGKSTDDLLKTGLNEQAAPATTPETRNEKIEGETATLEVKDSKSGNWETVPFVKEDGQWKIAMDKMSAQSPGAK